MVHQKSEKQPRLPVYQETSSLTVKTGQTSSPRSKSKRTTWTTSKRSPNNCESNQDAIHSSPSTQSPLWKIGRSYVALIVIRPTPLARTSKVPLCWNCLMATVTSGFVSPSKSCLGCSAAQLNDSSWCAILEINSSTKAVRRLPLKTLNSRAKFATLLRHEPMLLDTCIVSSVKTTVS